MTTINEKKKKWIELFENPSNNSQTQVSSMIDLVKYPVITEKTYLSLYKNRQYTFDIDKRLTKIQIKKLFSALFNVNVVAVNTHIPPRKQIRVGIAQGFRPTYKRAIITLKEGESINYNISNISTVQNNTGTSA
jgi:large subunit ribosomal protein L23